MIYKEERPWGTFEILSESVNFKIKKIIVLPGKRLSLQSHKKRSEHWIILKGNGIVTLADKKIKVSENDQIFIPVNQKHRIQNTGAINLEFIEVQTGNHFGEEDIIRYEDDFDRT